MSRVVSIGLDGAAWHKLDDLIDAGRLPNLERIREAGAHGTLTSTHPPVTCPAWRCSTSGKNPGKLGVYWWLDVDRSTGSIGSPDSRSFRTADVWDYLTDEGIRSAILNVPMTYPPYELDGTMVSGFGATFDDPDPEGSITHPPEFQRELLDRYDWTVAVDDVTTDEGLEETYDVIRSRFELLEDLLAEDYGYLHLTVFYINALEHKYGDGPETTRGWEIIDEYLGRLDLEDDLVVLYSDHGHQTVEHTFAVNKWLIENGHLSIASESTDTVGGGLYSLLSSLGLSPKRLAAVARNLLPESVYDRIVPSNYPIPSSQLDERVDWSGSNAVATSQGPLYVNRDRLGEEYESFRADLEDELRSLRHDGAPVLDEVYRAERIYDGPYVDEGPDLMLVGSDGWEIYGGIVPSVFESQAMSWTSGNHPSGMVAVAGDGVAPGSLDPRSIYDLMPTVLAYLGCAIPTDVDGEVIEEAFEEGVLEERYRRPIDPQEREAAADRDELEGRLEDLGYLE